jgi:hypothetical protein
MTRLTWGTIGERYFETGADRGVLFVPGLPGVAWQGLTAVKESPKGGDAQPYYIDGFKYANVAANEEFEATIEAYSSPPEFSVCDGIAAISNGLFVTQQPRKSFGLCYRTMLGNDVDGSDHAYKLHMIYNALAAPSSKDNNSVSDSVSPVTFSWAITTLPPMLSSRKPTAHLVVDSRFTPSVLLMDLEDMLYGSDSSVPYLPDPTELMAMFAA